MRVVADTSVWSLVLRRGQPPSDPHAAELARMLAQGERVVLLGIVLQEILQGIRDPAQFETVRSYLEDLPLLRLERRDYVAAAELWNACMAGGVQASSVYFQIAAACIEHDCALLSADQDFQHIARFCALQLL